MDRVTILTEIGKDVSRYFGHWEDSVVNMKDFKVIIESSILDSEKISTDEDFFLMILKILGKLNNGHTTCLNKNALKRIYEDKCTNSFNIDINDRWYISKDNIEEINEGFEVISIGDVPINLFINDQQEIFPEISKNKTLRLNQYLPFTMKNNFISYMEKDDVIKTEDFTKKLYKPNLLKTSYNKYLNDRVLYIKVPSFLEDEYEFKALDIIEKNMDVEKIIIDVRDNHGGSTPKTLISKLMNIPWYGWSERKYNETCFSTPEKQNPETDTFQGELYILVNKNTFSAAEDFVAPFKDNGRATIVGQTTFGSSGQPYYREIDDYLISIGSLRVRFRDGTEFEGIGIKPDTIIEDPSISLENLIMSFI